MQNDDKRPEPSLEPGLDLLLGWTTQEEHRPIGFGKEERTQKSLEKRRELLRYSGDAHAISIAPTGTGKTTGVMVPNLLHYQGSVVVVDIKGGELTRITARRRRELGQNVVVLDPLRVTDEEQAGLNPMEMFALPDCDLDSDAEMLAALLGRGNGGTKDPFWDQNGTALLAAVIAHVASLPLEERKISKVFDILLADDVVYNLAVLLDTVGKSMPKMAYREIAAFLQMPDITRGGVLSTTLSYLKTLHSPSMLASLDQTTFSFEDFIAGKPMSIYLILPVDKLQSHRAVLKLWIGTLLKAIVSRTFRPEQRTLLMIDECGQLGHFPFLEMFITLCRGYSCSVWTCFQDLAQLQTHYPLAWKTLLNNCGIIQAFGFTNRNLATQWSTYLDAGPSELRALTRGEGMVSIVGEGETKVERLNYLKDREFHGQFDPNPLYHAKTGQPRRPRIVAKPPDTPDTGLAKSPKRAARNGSNSSDSSGGRGIR